MDGTTLNTWLADHNCREARLSMGQAVLENRTPFVAEVLYLADEEGRNLLVLVVKATYLIDGTARPRLAEEQAPLNLTGTFWGEPENSSYQYEPECAFVKVATDVVLLGHAHAPRSGTAELLVTLGVGSLRKTVRVVGDRVWFKSLGSLSMTRPLAFERMPLVYERAFGGWDRTDPDPALHACEPRNPVGVGFRKSARGFEEGLRLPNLEDPEHPLKELGQRPPPGGFGFTSPHWQPRASLAGTYDKAWSLQRMPLLPRDFDRRFFSAASSGLIVPGYLRGDEGVALLNASPGGRLAFPLPGVAPPAITVEQARGRVQVAAHLDTVILDADALRLYLLWRGCLVLEGEPQDVRAVTVSIP